MVERLTLSLAGDSSPPQFKRPRFLQKLGHFPHSKTKAYINLNKSNSCVQTSVCQTSRNDMLIMKPAHIVTGYPISYVPPHPIPGLSYMYLTCARKSRVSHLSFRRQVTAGPLPKDRPNKMICEYLTPIS